jgi:superfamily II DNA helicase RecQ
MCLKHEPFRNVLTGTSFQDICAVIVDEAHCIAQWGGDFRTAYGEIGKLRAFFPPHIPILATSATLTASALQEVRSQLSIDADDCFFLNLGNDRPNIAYSVHPMNSATDYESLFPLLTNKQQPSTPDDIIKSLVFVNKVLPAQLTARAIRGRLPKHLRKYVDYMHAHRTPKARRRAMRRFRQGKTRILIATEAAGMVRLFCFSQRLSDNSMTGCRHPRH